MTAVSLPPELIESFLGEAWETVSVLERLDDVDTQSRAIEIASHRLKSSAALFGFPQISNLSGLLEHVFGSVKKLDALEKQNLDVFAQAAAACLSTALERVTLGQQEGDLGLEFSNLGGAELLHRLVSSNPNAFVRAPQIENNSPLQTNDLQASTNQFVPTEEDEAVKAEKNAAETLQHFFKNNNDVWEYFAPEVTEHLEAATQALEKLETGFDTDALSTLFRGMHTIKGAAYSVGCEPLGKAAHGLEDVLSAVRDGGLQWNENIAKAMFTGIDTLSMMLRVAENNPNYSSQQLSQSWHNTRKAVRTALGQEEPEGKNNLGATLENADGFESILNQEKQTEHANKNKQTLAKTTNQNAQDTSAPRTLRVQLSQLENLTALSIETMVARGRLETMLLRFDALDQTLESNRINLTRALTDFSERHLNPQLQQSIGATKKTTPITTGHAGPFITAGHDAPVITAGHAGPVMIEGKNLSEVFTELEFDRYDDLNILARKVAEMSGDFNEIRTALASNIADLRQEIGGLEKLVRSQQSEVARMRLVSIQRLFSRVRRQVRSLLGEKKIELECIGDVELDNTVMESLVEPIIHLISNAIAHGIESPEERIRLGKPEYGQLRVRAELRGTVVELEVSEDGRGIDVEAVKRRAVQKNLRRQEEVDSLSHDQALDLVFLPGLSTRELASLTAGRGVGMDVVWNSVRALKGEIKIESTAGKGASFLIRVPQNLSVTDVLFLRVGETQLAWPRDGVVGLKSISQGLLQATINHQGTELPVRKLSEVLNIKTNPNSFNDNISVIVFEIDEQPHAFSVHEVLSVEQALVRPLETPLSKLRHLVGTIISSKGQVVPMLSPAALLKLERSPQHATVAAAKQNLNMHVLLIDDSLSVRKAVAGTIGRLGYEVTTAIDGEDAWEKLQTSSYGAIITDLEMPKLNGYELVQRLRGHALLAHLPVAMLTTRASDKHRELALSLGVNEYLTKPIEERKLQKFLEHANEVVA